MSEKIPAEYHTLYLLKKLKYHAEMIYHSYNSEIALSLVNSLKQMHDEELNRLRMGEKSSDSSLVYINFARAFSYGTGFSK